jgi:hypothetical protein
MAAPRRPSAGRAEDHPGTLQDCGAASTRLMRLGRGLPRPPGHYWESVGKLGGRSRPGSASLNHSVCRSRPPDMKAP